MGLQAGGVGLQAAPLLEQGLCGSAVRVGYRSAVWAARHRHNLDSVYVGDSLVRALLGVKRGGVGWRGAHSGPTSPLPLRVPTWPELPGGGRPEEARQPRSAELGQG